MARTRRPSGDTNSLSEINYEAVTKESMQSYNYVRLNATQGGSYSGTFLFVMRISVIR